MKKIALFALILLVPALVLAQGERTLTRNLWENLRVTSVENMKACNASSLGSLTVVNDGDTATDCTTGDGEEIVICQCDGSAWAAVVPATPDLDFVALAPGFEGEFPVFDEALGEITGSGIALSVKTIADPEGDLLILTPVSGVGINLVAGDSEVNVDENQVTVYGLLSVEGVIEATEGITVTLSGLPTCDGSAEGMVVFVSPAFCGCNGSAWVNLSTGGVATPGQCSAVE